MTQTVSLRVAIREETIILGGMEGTVGAIMLFLYQLVNLKI